jgi:hypothetical protein
MISNYEPKQHYYYVTLVASHSCTAFRLLGIEDQYKELFIIPRWRGKHFDEKKFSSGGGQKAE